LPSTLPSPTSIGCVMAKAENDLQSMLSNGMNPKELPWYEPSLDEVPEPAKTLLEKYSKIPSDLVLQHVMDVVSHLMAFALGSCRTDILVPERARLLGSKFAPTRRVRTNTNQFPYPCIGSFRFLDLSIPQSPVYSEVLQRLKSGEKLLDVGCAVGQELRQLVFDGVASENIYASDMRRDFFDIGYDLFADRNTLKSEFIMADIFDDNSDLVKKLTGSVNIVNAASFFHLFSWDQQVQAIKRVITLLRPEPGSLLIGRQAGREDPHDPDDKENSPSHFRHDSSTWKKLWDQVRRETGTKWQVETWKEEWADVDQVMAKYHVGVQTYKLRFVSRRI
ncbi:hypothetical protein N7532_009384, partial [Penicillium argentinense]